MSIFKKKTIIKFFPLIFLHSIIILIIFLNFPQNKFFLGWDAVNPEFDFLLNFKRSLFAVWQEEYGAGTMTGHGFAALLPHTLITFLFSLFLPLFTIRFTFTFLCFYLGGLGMYFLFQEILARVCPKEIFKKYDGFLALVPAFFYLFNLATIQAFYFQLEAFIVHFASLPWLFWITLRLIKKLSGKNLFLCFLINIFASTQAFTSPLFIVYFTSLLIFLAFYLLAKKASLQARKKTFFILIFTLIINAYWFLPLSYYALTKGITTKESYNNIISTQDFVAKSRKYGDLKSLVFLKSFQLDIRELGDYVFQPWLDFQQKPSLIFIGYTIFSLVLVGCALSLIYFKKWFIKAFAALFIFFFANLATDLPPFSFIVNFLQETFPVYLQTFRNSFTKFSLAVGFFYSLFLGLAVVIFIKLLYKHLKQLLIGLYILILFVVILSGWPHFRGNFLYKKLTLDLPQSYFEVFDFFKEQLSGRIVDLPQGCAEGWYSYSWGYFGSGFLWYGVKQPIMARSFDVWSSANENYYWEVTQAIEQRDFGRFDSILEKYGTSWVLYDPSLIHCRNTIFKHSPQLLRYLDESMKYSLRKEFGDIKVYQVNLETPVKDFVFLASELVQVNDYFWNNDDTAFSDYGHYLSTNAAQLQADQSSVIFPFRSLFSGRQQSELEFNVREGFDSFVFSSLKIPSITPYSLFITPLNKVEGTFWTKDLEEQSVETPSVEIKDNKIEVKIDKQKGYFTYDSLDDESFFQLKPKSCNPFNSGIMKRKMVDIGGKRMLRFESVGSSNCLSLNLPRLIQKTGYLVKIQSQYLEGKALLFKIINETSKNTVIETELPKDQEISWFIIPPQQSDGQGYTFHFDNISIGRQKTINDLGGVEVYPIPYRFLKSIKLINQDKPIINSKLLAPDSVYHPNPSFYKIQLDKDQLDPNFYLALSQSYHPGWIAWQDKLFGGKRLDHVLINNWQNGWKIEGQPAVVYLFFWPQLLEYFGFTLLPICLVFILSKRKK